MPTPLTTAYEFACGAYVYRESAALTGTLSKAAGCRHYVVTIHPRSGQWWVRHTGYGTLREARKALREQVPGGIITTPTR